MYDNMVEINTSVGRCAPALMSPKGRNRNSSTSEVFMSQTRTPMTEARRGEIALRFVRRRMKEKGITFANFKRDVGNEAKALDISTEEAMEFIEIMVKELMNEAFPPKK